MQQIFHTINFLSFPVILMDEVWTTRRLVLWVECFELCCFGQQGVAKRTKLSQMGTGILSEKKLMLVKCFVPDVRASSWKEQCWEKVGRQGRKRR